MEKIKIITQSTETPENLENEFKGTVLCSTIKFNKNGEELEQILNQIIKLKIKSVCLNFKDNNCIEYLDVDN